MTGVLMLLIKPALIIIASALLCTCGQGQVPGFPPEQYPTLDRYLGDLYPGLSPLGPPIGMMPSMAREEILSPISQMGMSRVAITTSILWIVDPTGQYYSRLTLSLPQGELSRIELIPGAAGDLTFHKTDPSNKTSTYHQGRVEAGYRYSLWFRADAQGESELWYSLDGQESNHIWFDVYSPESQEYFRYSKVN